MAEQKRRETRPTPKSVEEDTATAGNAGRVEKGGQVSEKAEEVIGSINAAIDEYRKELGEDFAKNYVQRGGE